MDNFFNKKPQDNHPDFNPLPRGEKAKPAHIRLIIYIIPAILILFIIFMTMNSTKNKPFKNIQGDSSLSTDRPAESREAAGESAPDDKILSKAQQSVKIRQKQQTEPSIYQPSDPSGSGIAIVKEPAFESVAEPPKSPMELLQELTEQSAAQDPERRKPGKPAPIFVSREAFRKKIEPVAKNKQPSLSKKSMPVLGEDSDKQSPLITAPVDYKVFKDQQTWDGFAYSQRGKLDESCKPVDFTVKEIAILVSMSEFPSGIFRVVGVLKGRNETIIQYRIDPLLMSAEYIPREYDHYSCAVIEKNNLPIRLEQVP